MPPNLVADLRNLTAVPEAWIEGQPGNGWFYANTILVGANTILVGITLFFLIRYTKETTKLRKEAEKQNAATANILIEAQRQNELARMPIFALYLDRTAREETLILKNVGEAPAFNVMIETKPSKASPSTGEHEIGLSLSNNAFSSNEEQRLRLDVMMANGRSSNMNLQQLCQWMTSGYYATTAEFIIHCVSLDSKPYRFVFKFANDAGKPNITYDRYAAQ